MLTEIEKKVLVYISDHELEISRRPFSSIADALGMREEEVTSVLVGLVKKGVIENIRAVVNHTKLGYKENALIAWHVNPEAVDAIKNVFIENDLISHSYERESQDGFNYNIFIMMHAKERKDMETFVNRVAETFAVDYIVLSTEEELKKEKLDLRELLCNEC